MRNNNGGKLLYTAEKLISREGYKGTSLQILRLNSAYINLLFPIIPEIRKNYFLEF